MHVNIRTFSRVILSSLILSAIGLLLDLDHWYATVKGWPETQWFHHTLASTPSLLILLSIFWGLIVGSLALGWDHLESKAIFLISQEMKLEIARTRADELPLELLLDQEMHRPEVTQEE
jgi:hypothetical protein